MTISEVSERCNISSDKLRYYEREGLIPNIHRSKGGFRNYTEEDCKWINFIKVMRDAGIPIEDLMEYAALLNSDENTEKDKIDFFQTHKAVLIKKAEQINKCIDFIDERVNQYHEE